MERNACLSAIDALSKIGVNNKRNALYKRVEREFNRLTSAEVHTERMVPSDVTLQCPMTDMSSITSYEHSNPANAKKTAGVQPMLH